MENIDTTSPGISVTQTRRMFVLVVLTYIIIQSDFGFIEKKTFWGELFVLLTLFSINNLRSNVKGSQKHILFGVCCWMVVFPIYGTVVSLLYWDEVLKPIFLLRHLCFFYYSVFFFFAYKYADLIIDYLKKFVKLFVAYCFASALYRNRGISPALIGLLFVAINQVTYKKVYFYLGFIGGVGLLLMGASAGTTKIILLLYLGFLLLNTFARYWTRLFSPRLNWIMLFGLSGGAIYIAISFIHDFYLLTTNLALLGQGIAVLGSMTEDLYTDLSGFWRLVLWSHLYGRFIENPMGLGLGTPLFADWLDGFVMLHLYNSYENYVQGAHNSFVTFIARMGIPCLMLWLYLFYHISKITIGAFRHFNFRPLKTRDARLASGIFLAFAGVFINAQFNVVLESPLYSGIFWFTFGLFTKIVGDFSIVNPRSETLLDGKK